MDASVIITSENLLILLKGAVLSLGIALISVILGILLGIMFASMKTSKSKVLKVIANIYIEVIRGTPMLLQILFIFLGFPYAYKLIAGKALRMNIYICGIVALSINSSAYCAELIRANINGVDPGQREAGKTLGLKEGEIMKSIILPQALRNMVPAFVSEFIMLIKDSSLLGTIGVMDLLQTSRVIGSKYYNFLVPLLLASGYYLTMTIVTSYFASKLERKLKL